MKLELNDLTNALAKKTPQTIKPVSPEKPFLQGFAENVTQVMNVLDSIGIKDLFIEKARQELEGRLFGGRTTNLPGKPADNPRKGVNESMIKPKLDIEKIISLGLLWLDRFIEKNGDMPLSQFRQAIEDNKEELIKTIKGLGIGL